MELRQFKALEIAARHPIVCAGGVWLVPSQSRPSQTYRVTLGDRVSCECDDFQLRRADCQHILAARIVCARDHRGQAPEFLADAAPRRPSYRQNWPLYNEAQQTEKYRFRVLLFDLCRGLAEPPQPGSGRRRTSLADRVFACALKVFTTLSARRFACDLRDAYDRGYLSHLMNSVSVCAYLESAVLTPVLQQLIVRSSLPLRALETTFAPDSSGFSACRFVRWYDEKYGVERSEQGWVKAHIMSGVRTNVVTAVEIHDRHAADGPQFKSLLATTAQHFTVKEVPADKAYSSRENVEAVAALDAFPAIAFKANATGGVGGAFAQLYHYYSFHREEFLKVYHQRSNVESTFAMVKAKFGDAVRSKNETAMRNEALCKFLCHNICCVIQSQIELGVEPVFWSDSPSLPPPADRATPDPAEMKSAPLQRNSA